MPLTTSGRSVHRSSRPKKSPYSLFSPANVESPRLWYMVGSFSHAGTLTFASAGPANSGVYGNEPVSTFGKPFVPSAVLAKLRSSNGRPFKGYKYRGSNFDHAHACTSRSDKRCVTLGIPPTVDVANPKWGMNARDRRLAERYVDAYLWFGRPWLYNQAAPFLLDRALELARTTPY